MLDICISNWFYQSVAYLFIFLTMSFEEQKIFTLIKSNSLIFMVLDFCVLRNLCLSFTPLFFKTTLLKHNLHTMQFIHLNSSMDFFLPYGSVQPVIYSFFFFFLMFIHCLNLSPSLSLCSEHCFSITHPWLCGDSSGNY